MTTPAPSPAGQDRLVQAGLLLAFAAVFAPIVMARVPLLLDYPNHLARFWLLSGGDRVAPISAMYRIDWSRASTNIGIDLVVTALGKFLPYQAVGKLIAIAALAGPPAGAALLNRMVFNRWHWWQLSLPILAWTTTALMGFLSYQIALALALFFACLEPALAKRPMLGVAMRMACGAAILLFHPFGLLFYGALLAALAIGPGWRDIFVQARLLQIARGLAVAAAVVAIPAVLLYTLASTPPGAHVGDHPFLIWTSPTPYHLILTAASPFASYGLSVDALFLLPLLAICGWAAWVRRLNAHAGLFVVGVLTAILALMTPGVVGDAGYVDRRFPLMAALMLFASLQPQPTRRFAGVVWLAAVLLIVDLGKSSWIASIWSAREGDVRSIERALGATPPGSAIFTVQVMPASVKVAPVGRYLAGIVGNTSESTLRHMPALVVPERHAFIPTLFTVPGQQPLRVLAPWSNLAVPSSAVPDAHVLDGHPTKSDLKADPYLADWRRSFDYVLVIGADLVDGDGPFTLPPHLRFVAGDAYARLFKIEH
ncbi:hypothetical protein [Phenylobacterium sp.]|uniref:hypothetical protein n=1 Tax=Phenylobacterium sp. TaxID=1871053 RepID=UPI002F40CDC7